MRLKILCSWTATAACALLCSSAWATFTASVERNQLAPGEAVLLTLQSDVGGGQPDLTPLTRDFDVLGRSTGSSLQIINGRASSLRQIVLTLAPKRGGRIDIPALQWNGERSDVLPLNVSANGAGSGGSGSGAGTGAAAVSPHVFITTEMTPKQPYVQSAVALKVRLYSNTGLYQASLDLPGSNDVQVQRIGKDVQTQETRDGRDYLVVERTYVMFPQRSGELQLNGPVLDAQVADDQVALDPLMGRMFGQLRIPRGIGGTRPLRLHGDGISLSVRARPPGMDGTEWLPARELTLDARWQPADTRAAAGQPVTQHLVLSAVGLNAGQLPDLSTLLNLPPGLKAYPDQAKLTNDEQDGTVAGRREQDIAFLADRPGRYELPALKVAWWNTVANQRREITLPSRTLDVVADAAATPGAPAAKTAPPTAAPAGVVDGGGATGGDPRRIGAPVADGMVSMPWAWVSLGLGVLWLATLGVWAWSRRSHGASAAAIVPSGTQPASTGAALRQALKACRENAPQPARDATLAWARSTWPDQPPAGLNALARRIGDPSATPLLQELDRACITDAPWQGAPLARILSMQKADRAAAPIASVLPDLYPEQKI